MAKVVVDIYDKDGKIIDEIPYGVNGITGVNVNGARQNVYASYSDDGTPSYSADMGASSSKISLDKNTGNVKIEAPEIFYQSQTYQEKIKPVLETISQNYKLNDEYKYALLNDENDTKTSEDWVNEIQKDIITTVSGVVNNERVKQQILEKDGVQLNDEQLIKMSSVALKKQPDGSEVEVKDDTIQSMPEFIKNLSAFKNLKGWQDGKATYKDIMDAWNREHTSDEDILQVYDAINEYFETGDFKDADEYAEAVAFSQFIAEQNPHTGFWRGVGDFIGNIFYNAWAGTGTAVSGVLNALEGVANLAGRAGTTLGSGISKGDWEFADEPATGELNFVKDYLIPELEHQISANQTNAMKLNTAAGTTGAIAHELSALGTQIVFGMALGNAAAAGVKGVASKLIVGSKAAKAAVAASEGALTAEKIAVATVNGTNFMLRSLSANKANAVIASAIGTLKAYQTGTTLVAGAADIAAQIIVDVAIQDSKLCRQFLDGNVDAETKAYILEQIALDAGGYAVAVGVMKTVKAVGKTDVGKVANAAIVPRINKMAAKIGGYTDAIKIRMHGGDANWNQSKADRLKATLEATAPEGWKRNRLENQMGAAQRRQQNLENRRIERGARAKIGELSGPFKDASNWSDIVENAERLKRESDKLFTAAHYTADRVYKGDVQAKVTSIKNDVRVVNESVDNYTRHLSKAIKAENAAGLTRSSKVMEIGNGRVLSTLSEASNEYVNGMYRLQLGKDARPEMLKIGKSVAGVDQEIAYYTKATNEFREKYPELAGRLDELLSVGKSMSAATQDARVYENVLTQATLDERRASPYFRNGYLRTQRSKDWQGYHQRGGELDIGKIRDDQHLNWGFEGDEPDKFQDITFVLFDDLTQVAKQSIRKTEIDYLKELGEQVDVFVSGDKVERAKKVDATKERAVKTIEGTTKNAVKEMDPSIFNEVFDYKQVKSALGTAQMDAMDAGANVSRAKISPIKISSRKLKGMINDRQVFPDDIVKEVVDDKLGKSIADFTEKEWDDFISKAPKNVKSSITGQMRDVAALDTEYGLLNKSSLPKIRTSDFTRATGLQRKDADDWLKPFLSEKNGLPMDTVLASVGDTDYDFLVNQSRVGNAWERVEDIYRRVANRDTRVGLNYQDWTNFLDNGGNMRLDSINRAILANNYDDIWDFDNKIVRAFAEDIERNKAIFDAETLYAKNIKKLNELKETFDMPALATNLNEQMDEVIDGFIDANRKDKTTVEALKALDDSDDIVEYATLKSLTEKGNLEETKRKLRIIAEKEYNGILTANNKVIKDGKEIKRLSGAQLNKQAEQWAEQTVMWYEERVNQRFDQVANRLREAGNDIVDYDDLFGRIQAINDDIAEASKTDNIVKTYDDIGREEYVRLSPTVAHLITTMPTPLRRGMFGEIQQEFVQIFRAGTTGGLVPQSLIRQYARDTGSAVVEGNVTRTRGQIRQQLDKVYGSTIAEYYEKEMPGMWDTLLARADETGESVERLAVENELSRAKTYASDQVQSKLYQFNREARMARNQDGVYYKEVFGGIKNKLEDFLAKTEKLNNIRETNRRIQVYQNAYLDALNNGHTVPMARRYAEMIQAEATTNFSRQAYHLANLTHTVPYLGAAINGSKSFWRLMAIDPVGITTRIVGGYVVPMIALTNISINDPENREVYKSIPEYEKDDNLVFVINGQKLSIPVPQEISSFIRPIQSMIEKMAGANDHSAAELMANNLAGLFPYELQGFVNIDSDRILTNNVIEGIWYDHLAPGFSMLSSQMMGPLVKSGVMAVTGYDPYTRKRINTAYTTTDPLTGESKVIDYKSGELAKMLGNIFKGNLGVSAEMAQAIFNNLLGTGNMNIIDGLSDIAASVPTEEGIGSGLTKFSERVAEATVKPLYTPKYNEESNAAWNRATRVLYKEKEDMINDPEYQADIKALSSGDLSEEAQQKVLARINTKQEQFQEKVLQASKNLVNNYDNGTLDRYKFATVISLMAFSNGYNPDPTDPLSKQQSKESYNLARAKAIETMAQMGFDSPNDHSIFGYYEKNDKTGEIGVQFYSPLTILNFEKSSSLQDDVALANIKTIVNDADLWNAHKALQTQVNAIRAKGKLTTQAKADIDALYIMWNSQVAKEVAPYVARMTPEAAINNKAVKDYLHSLIEVPYSWSTNDKGKSVYLGDDGNRKDAYYESWIKSMFSINDKYKGQY